MDSRSPKDILVIRFSSLGDVVLSTVVLANLKAQWPQSKLSVATKSSFASVFEGNPHVDRVLIFGKSGSSFSQLMKTVRSQKWDVILDLQGNMKSWLLRFVAGGHWTVVVSKLTLARWILLLFKKSQSALSRSVRQRNLDCLEKIDTPIVHTDTRLYASDPSETLKNWGVNPAGRLIGIAPGARHATKRWPAAKFAEAANRLGAMPNTTVLILGDQSDKLVADEVSKKLVVPHVNLAGKTNLKELISVVSKLSFLLTNDSGLLHIGEAFQIPLVAIFGPTVRGFGFGPYRTSSRVAEVVNLPCRPCTLHGDDQCPLKHHQCMNDIDVNAVLYVASDLMESVAKGPV